MDEFDDIFGEVNADTAATQAKLPGDDDIDALFGISSPTADAAEVREAMEATAAANASNKNAESYVTSTPSKPDPLGKLDDSFADIFGDSPTSNISSDIIAAFQSANEDIDAALKNATAATDDSTDVLSLGTKLSIHDEEDEEVTEFVAPDYLHSSAAVTLDDRFSPQPSPRASETVKAVYDDFSNQDDLPRPRKMSEVSDDDGGTGASASHDDNNPQQSQPFLEHDTVGAASAANALALVKRTMRRLRLPHKAAGLSQEHRRLSESEEANMIRKLGSILDSASENREWLVRCACQELLDGERPIPPSMRAKVWILLLGVANSNSTSTSNDNDNKLENTMLESAEEDLVNQGELRSECSEASTWAAAAQAGISGNIEDSGQSSVDAMSADMDLLMTFFSKVVVGGTLKGNTRYVPGLAQLVAPFYAAGFVQTTTIYKCLRAVCGAFLPASVESLKTWASMSQNNTWKPLLNHNFGLLLRYHDPELEAHLSLCIAQNDVVPHSWLYCGFVAQDTGGSFTAHARALMHIWDWIIVKADPMSPWLLTSAMLIANRDEILASPAQSTGSQNASTQRMVHLLNKLATKLLAAESGSSSCLTAMIGNADKLRAVTPRSFCDLTRNNFAIAQTTSGRRVKDPSSSIEWYLRLFDFYIVHNRAKINNLAGLLDQFRGCEHKLVRKIEKKYKPFLVSGRHRFLAAQCAWVSAEEVVPHLFSLLDPTEDPISYFFIDCRPSQEVSCGKFGSAWHIDPEILLKRSGSDAPNALLEPLMALRGEKHICIIGSGRNRLLEVISKEEAVQTAAADNDRVAQCVQLFLNSGRFPLVSVVRGGFDACYDAVKSTDGASLAEMVDYDPEQCRPSRYYRYKNLQSSNPKAAQILKSYALKAIEEKRAALGSSKNISEKSKSGSTTQRRGQAYTEGSLFRGGRPRLPTAGIFGRKTNKSTPQEDPVESAIIAAKEAVEKSKSRKSIRDSASNGWAAMRSFGNRVGKVVKEKAKQLQEQQQKQQQKQPSMFSKSLARRHSSPATSTRGSSDLDILDVSPLNSPISGPDRSGFKDNSDLVDDDDDDEDDDDVDFSLSSAPAPGRRPSNSSIDGVEDDESKDLPIEITHQEPLLSVDELKVGNGFVETDFKTTVPHAQWFACELIPETSNDVEESKDLKGWEWSESLIVCSSHVVGVRIYRQCAVIASVSEKAKKAGKEVAKRLGKWMGRLKQSSASGLSSKQDDADRIESLTGESMEELEIVGSDGRSGSSHLDSKDVPVLPKLVRVEFVASILTISRMTRKKTMSDVVTLYFGDNLQIMCRLADPGLCIKAMRNKAKALDKAGLRKVPDRQSRAGKTAEKSSNEAPTRSTGEGGGSEGGDESGVAPVVPSAPRPDVGMHSELPPASPTAASDAFSFGDGDSDSDDDANGGDGGSNINSENPFDNW